MTDEPRPTLAPWTTHPDVVERPAWTPGLRLASWLWAVAPFFTVGIANPLLFFYAAIRRKTWPWWLAFLGYAGMVAVLFSITDATEGSVADTIFTTVALTNFMVGTGHALVVRSRVFRPDPVLDLDQEPVLEAAIEADERRDLARRILAQDPPLASELAIGRPDLGRGYDDGGLVDVNTAPATVLALLPGIDAETAQRVLMARDAASGFTSIEELAVLADLPPPVVDAIRDRAVFSPR